ATSVAGPPPPGPPAQAPGGRAGVANSSSVPSGASEDRAPDPEEDDALYRENVPGLFGALGGAIAILGGTTASSNMNTDEVSKRGQYNDPEKSSSAEQVFSNTLAPGFLSLDATRNINGAEMKMKKKKKKKKEINDTASSVLSERGTKAQIISSTPSTVEYYSVSSRAVVPKAGLDFISGRSSSSSSSSSANGFTRVAPTGSDEMNLNAIGITFDHSGIAGRGGGGGENTTNANTLSGSQKVNMSKSSSSSSSLEEDQTNHDDLVNMYEDDAAWLRIQGQQGSAGACGSSGPSR
ncbi:unnamed protein product, partial [Amoebophrya sp. A120]